MTTLILITQVDLSCFLVNDAHTRVGEVTRILTTRDIANQQNLNNRIRLPVCRCDTELPITVSYERLYPIIRQFG
jgi:hypothetical protein